MKGSARGFFSFLIPSFRVQGKPTLPKVFFDRLPTGNKKFYISNAIFLTFAKSFWTGSQDLEFNKVPGSKIEVAKQSIADNPIRNAFLAYIGSSNLAKKPYDMITKPEIFWAACKSIIFIPLGILQIFTEVTPLTISMVCEDLMHAPNASRLQKVAASTVGLFSNLWYFVGRSLTSPVDTIRRAAPKEKGGPLGGLLVFMFVVFLHVLITAAIINLLITSGPFAPFLAGLANTIAVGAPWLNTIGAAFSTFVLPMWGAALGGGSTLLNIVLASTFFATLIGFPAKMIINYFAIKGLTTKNFKNLIKFENSSNSESESIAEHGTTKNIVSQLQPKEKNDEILDLSNKINGPEDAQELINSLSDIPKNKTVLILSHNKLDTIAPDLLCDMFSEIPEHVTQVQLCDSNLKSLLPSNLIKIFNMLPKTIKSVDLSENQFEKLPLQDIKGLETGITCRPIKEFFSSLRISLENRTETKPNSPNSNKFFYNPKAADTVETVDSLTSESGKEESAIRAEV